MRKSKRDKKKRKTLPKESCITSADDFYCTMRNVKIFIDMVAVLTVKGSFFLLIFQSTWTNSKFPQNIYSTMYNGRGILCFTTASFRIRKLKNRKYIYIYIYYSIQPRDIHLARKTSFKFQIFRGVTNTSPFHFISTYSVPYWENLKFYLLCVIIHSS